MSFEDFVNQKKQILCRLDNSKKGSIDARIESLVQFINSINEYVTTSSCSGRLILFCEEQGQENKKKGCKWLYTTHSLVEDEALISKLNPEEGNAVLKFEPFILHVRCFDVDSAKILLTCALESGFKNSGFVFGKHGKIVLAVRSCLGLEVPLTNDGALLVPEEYVRYLVGVTNKKFYENFKKTEKFFCLLKEKFTNKCGQ